MTLTALGTTTSVLLGDGENYWLRTKEEGNVRRLQEGKPEVTW